MKPKRLIISGWGPYKNKTEIDFERFEGKGLFLLTGATGAGKTTIFDAISYALYGRLSGETREKNSVRSDFAEIDTPTFVELFMEHAGKEYHILRNPEYTRPKKRSKSGSVTKEKENAILYFEDGTVLEGIKEVNARMQEILVLDYDQFKQITMIAQGEFARLLTASPKEKTAIFRDIFGTGIYENFTRLLRERAKNLYGDVQEQKHKLEEDIRLLLSGENGPVDSVSTDTLKELTSAEYWKYDAILEELKLLLKQAKKEERALEKESKRLQEKKDALTAEITQKELANKQMENLESAQKKLQVLETKKDSMEEKGRLLVRARSAASIEPFRLKVKNAQKLLQEKEQALQNTEQRKQQLCAEQVALRFFEEKQVLFQNYLEKKRALESTLSEEKKTESIVAKAFSEWETAKEAFAKAESVREVKREKYEEAEKAYRHAVVGIAAKLLQEGEPCPVCGSREHPKPAKAEAGVLSEEELKKLKTELEKADKEMVACQEKAVMMRTRAEEQKNGLQKLQDQKQELQIQLKGYEEELLLGDASLAQTFFTGFYEEQAALFQKKLERISQVAALLVNEEQLSGQTKTEIEGAKADREQFAGELTEALAKEGFATEAECDEALLPKAEILSLEQEKAAYEMELASTKSLVTHLNLTLKKKEKYDIDQLTIQAENYKINLMQVQNTLKKVHAFCGEVKKTETCFVNGMDKMAKAQEAYGCVGDLANLAGGNNAKRLVFEQFVLAGYFEEILRAANLRFYKMTGGRYEMSRISEAGDGRIKDSLEIQVMDYYTGKMRSVKTLSGGESFKASLSLALGMSDVIQAMSGGIRVDTLFIDEGFGALDSESLDQACETLMGLVEHNRLIGIISHVQELRERIDNQIVIEKSNNGSNIRVHA